MGNDIRTNLDANKLATVRRDIVNKNRLTTLELANIKEDVESEATPVTNVEATPEVPISAMEENAELHLEFSSEQHIAATDNDEEVEALNEAKEDIIRQEAIFQYTDINARKKLPKFFLSTERIDVIKIYNKALEIILDKAKPTNLTDLNRWIYAAAVSYSEKFNLFPQLRTAANRRSVPKWKKNMDKSVDLIRKELSHVEAISRGEAVQSKAGKRTKKKYYIKNTSDRNKINEIKEKLKQKLQAKSQRRRRIQKRCSFFQTK